MENNTTGDDMVLNNINKTIGGEEFISLPVALAQPFNIVVCDTNDRVFVNDRLFRLQKQMLTHARRDQEFFTRIYVGKFVAELIDKKTNLVNFRINFL